MRVRVCLDFPAAGLAWQKYDQIVDALLASVRNLVGASTTSRESRLADGEWEFAPEDRELVAKARAAYDELLPEGHKPGFERILLADFEAESTDAEHLLFPYIGDDASGGDSHDTAEGGAGAQNVVTCSECGHQHADPGVQLKIQGDRLPRAKRLFTLAGELSAFCRPQVRQAYLESGMTGLSFDPIAKQHSDGVPLFWITTALHIWQDQSGVCATCGTKTNVRGVQAFNLQEEYPKDFQCIRLFDKHLYVLSHDAVAFLSEHSHISMSNCLGPVMPGYLSEKVWPEDRLFKSKTWPVRVLRYG